MLRPSGPNITTCSSPYSYRINDRANHTLAVTFADVCGVNRTVVANFSIPYGWSTDAVLDTGSGSGSLPVPILGTRPQKLDDSPGNGAWGMRAGGLSVLGSLLFSLMLSWLVV